VVLNRSCNFNPLTDDMINFFIYFQINFTYLLPIKYQRYFTASILTFLGELVAKAIEYIADIYVSYLGLNLSFKI